MEAISGRTTKIRTMSNGQPRIEIELDCTLAEVAALFDVGAEVALARLNCKPESHPEKPKGGELAKLAGQLCANSRFQCWVKAKTGWPATEVDAVEYVRTECGVESRAQLDHDEIAAHKFHEFIRKPFVAWQEGSRS